MAPNISFAVMKITILAVASVGAIRGGRGSLASLSITFVTLAYSRVTELLIAQTPTLSRSTIRKTTRDWRLDTRLLETFWSEN